MVFESVIVHDCPSKNNWNVLYFERTVSSEMNIVNTVSDLVE